MKHERTCIVCGTKYSYCHRCGEYNSKETWRYMYCGENCKQIFRACSGYSFGSLAIDECRKLLDESDLTGLDNFNSQIRQNILDIKEETSDGNK